MIIYKDKDDIMRKGYFPKVSAQTENDIVIDASLVLMLLICRSITDRCT